MIGSLMREAIITPRYADLTGAAVYAGYGKRQLYQLVRDGVLAAYRPNGGKLLIDLRELDAFIRSHRHDPKTRLDRIVDEVVEEMRR